MLTKSFALEFGPEVRVNGVSPGSIIWQRYKNMRANIKQL